MFRPLFLFTLYFILTLNISAAEKIPDDIRYMLEDMYGENKKIWPESIYSRDLNNDGLVDWVAEKNNCLEKEKCTAEVFICIPGKLTQCSEYCYIEVKMLLKIEDNLKTLKCESTC